MPAEKRGTQRAAPSRRLHVRPMRDGVEQDFLDAAALALGV